MTQHRFSGTFANGDQYDVLAGWDLPMQQYFLVVESSTELFPPVDEDVLYSNVFDTYAPATDWSYFERVFEHYGIVPPEGFAEAIEYDRMYNRGNSVRHWESVT